MIERQRVTVASRQLEQHRPVPRRNAARLPMRRLGTVHPELLGEQRLTADALAQLLDDRPMAHGFTQP